MTRRKPPWVAIAAAALAGAALALMQVASALAASPLVPPTTLLSCNVWPVCVHVILQDTS